MLFSKFVGVNIYRGSIFLERVKGRFILLGRNNANKVILKCFAPHVKTLGQLSQVINLMGNLAGFLDYFFVIVF